MEKIFFDTGGIVAYLNKSDQFHEHALSAFEKLKLIKGGASLVTTDYVLDEVCSKFSKVNFRNKATEFIAWFRSNKSRKVVHIDERLFEQALQNYRTCADKEWSLTDCASFIVMKQEGIMQAFTTDKDFEQAGFIRLVK